MRFRIVTQFVPWHKGGVSEQILVEKQVKGRWVSAGDDLQHDANVYGKESVKKALKSKGHCVSWFERR